MSKQKVNTRALLLIALFVSLISVCAWISIPFTIPFTLQTLAIFLACLFLKAKKALVAVAIYLLIGFCGVPVFSGFSGGLAMLFSAQGGYLLGFLAIPLVLMIFEKNPKIHLLALFFGTLVCYFIGTLWCAVIFGGEKSFFNLLGICILPFIIPDTIKLFIAHFIFKRIEPR
jgi:biotin transport system substrate-specific component